MKLKIDQNQIEPLVRSFWKLWRLMMYPGPKSKDKTFTEMNAVLKKMF